jgi:hypothetical protein
MLAAGSEQSDNEAMSGGLIASTIGGVVVMIAAFVFVAMQRPKK